MCRTLTLAAAVLALFPTLVLADRPFLALTSAAAEEDDDRVWSIATVLDGRRRANTFATTAEYAFDPVRSIEIGLARSGGRDAAATTVEAQVEYKHLFNHIARDGYGWGLALGWGSLRTSGEGWRGGAWSLVLPLSVRIGASDALLHFNAGLVREPGERRQGFVAAGVEGEVWPRVTLFGEAAREGEARLWHAGARWWVRRERFAIDLAATQRREDGVRTRGAVLGLAWYDL